MKQGQGELASINLQRNKRCSDRKVGPSEAPAEARPPPAYCVSPGFFINRSTEEGRADREVVLQEGVGGGGWGGGVGFNRRGPKRSTQQIHD